VHLQVTVSTYMLHDWIDAEAMERYGWAQMKLFGDFQALYDAPVRLCVQTNIHIALEVMLIAVVVALCPLTVLGPAAPANVPTMYTVLVAFES
jgi:hypothetical protein